MPKPGAPGDPLVQGFNDLLELDPAQLSRCIAALRAWVGRTRRPRAEAAKEGMDPNRLKIEAFSWRPRSPGGSSGQGNDLVTPYTGVDEIGLRRAVVVRLFELNIFTLDDLSVSTEDELRAENRLGSTSIEILRTKLIEAGLEFRESEDPLRRALRKADIARRIPAPERQVDDASSIDQLGLRPATAVQLMRMKVQTVGDLRAQSLHSLFPRFGKMTLIEIVDTLKSVGLQFHTPPGQLEMWRYGVIKPIDLVHPQQDEAVQELAPWVGSAVTGALAKAGVATVAEARAIAEQLQAGEKSGPTSPKRIPGLGESGLARLQEYFAVKRISTVNGVPRGSMFPGG